MYKHTILFVNGKSEDHGSPEKLTLEEMQSIVGGYIERVRTRGGEDMLVDEDGRSKQLPYNPTASSLAAQSIVGTALLLHYKLR